MLHKTQSSARAIHLRGSAGSEMFIWLGGLPALSCPAAEERVLTVPARRAHIGHRWVGVELFRPRGVGFAYGLLGAEFRPTGSNRLAVALAGPGLLQPNCSVVGGPRQSPSPLAELQCELRVGVRDVPGEQLTREFGGRLCRARAGLPNEYAQSVLDGASMAGRVLGAGILRFHRAAHSREASSKELFHRLARLVVELMAINQASGEQVATVIQTYGDVAPREPD
jgi:hypothetical protein